jgi:uncharacterized protein YwgA
MKIDPKDLTDSIERNNKNDSYNFNSNFDKRLRIQKIVYLIEELTKDFNYNFSLYLRGPYSPDLAKEYYSLINEDIKPLKENYLKKETINIAKNLDARENLWLEIASTIRMMYSNGDETTAIKRTYDFKSELLTSSNKGESYVNTVASEMKMLNLL